MVILTASRCRTRRIVRAQRRDLHFALSVLLPQACRPSRSARRLLSPYPPPSPTAQQVSGAGHLHPHPAIPRRRPQRFNGSPGHPPPRLHQGPLQARSRQGQPRNRQLHRQHPRRPPDDAQLHRQIPQLQPGKKDGIIVLASHYETNYPLNDTAFVGANDGACTTALLIEIGQYLRTHPPRATPSGSSSTTAKKPSTGVVTASDYASTAPATSPPSGTQDGTLSHIKAFLVADMIGDKDLDIDRDDNSTPWLARPPRQAAARTPATPSNVFQHPQRRHRRRPPALHSSAASPSSTSSTIDYGPHTDADTPTATTTPPQDTIDKISPQSLQISADLFLELIRLINQR